MSEENPCCAEKMKIRTGYAYVPFQQLGKLYQPDAALKNGTVFPGLNLTTEEYERGLYNGR